MLGKTGDDAALLPSGFRPTRTSLYTVGAYDDEMPTATNGAHSIPLPLQGIVHRIMTMKEERANTNGNT